MREHRTEPRAGIMARIEVLWEDQEGTPHITPAKLEDQSRGGASIRIREPIGVGTKLIIQWTHGHFSGVVTYCNPHGDEYNLGVQRDPAEPAQAK